MPELENHLVGLESAARAPHTAVTEAGDAYHAAEAERAAELADVPLGDEHGEPFPPAPDAPAAEQPPAA